MGNIGNDASMEAVLGYLRANHPEAVVDAMCAGPETLLERYELPAIPMSWYRGQASGPVAIGMKLLGKVLDPVRIAAWTGRHDAVIIPGMGIFEAALPLRAWGLPYALLALGVSGRLTRTRVAYVSVGAQTVNQPVTRMLLGWAARLAVFRSYRDADSREAMRRWGLNVEADPVYPDLAFALPVPAAGSTDPRIVCVGVMDYHGSNDDRARADAIRRSYATEMKSFIRGLLDEGRAVRLIIGDTNGSDDEVVQEIVTDLRRAMPGLDPAMLTAQSVCSFSDIMQAMESASSVVAIRFHNVVAGIMLGKPTIAISYGRKHDSIMADSGIAEFCHPVQSLDHLRLARQFAEMESRELEVRHILADRKTLNEKLLADQFESLWEILIAGRSNPTGMR
jgi:polysaccharide pyruvyl transferase WcaK-like protein